MIKLYIYTIYIYTHYIYIYGLCQKRNKWTIARWGYLRESTHSHASIHEGRNSLRLCLCPRQGKYRQRPLWFLAVFTSFDLIILCKLMINLINHGLWDSHGYLMAGLSKSGMCNPPSELFSGFPSAQAMPGPLHILREDSLCHPRHVELWKMRVQRTSCATGQRAGSWRIIRGANFTVNHHDRVHGRMTIAHSSRALQVIHRNVHHSFPYSPRIPAIILDLFISLLFFWQLKCMQNLGFCWKSGVPSTRSPASLEEDEVLEDDLGTWSRHPGRTSAPGWGTKRLREGD